MPAWGGKRREAKELYRYGEYISASRGTGSFLLLQLDSGLKFMARVSHWPWSWVESFEYLARCSVLDRYNTRVFTS